MAKNKYAYTGNKDGKRVKGVIEELTEQRAYAKLKADGIIPDGIKVQTNTGLQMEIKIPGFEKGVKLKDLAIFAKQFAVLIKAGMPLVKSLETVTSQTQSKQLQPALELIQERIGIGDSLSDAMKAQPKVFPQLMTSLVTVGESGGFLDRSLDSVARTFKSELELKQRVKSAMTYPVIVLVVALLAVVGMLAFVVPTFQEMFAGLDSELPAPTQFLVTLSENLGVILPVGLGIGAAIFLWYRANKRKVAVRSRVDAFRLKMPVFGNLNKKVSITRFSRNLSMMLSAGVPLMKSLELVGASADNYIVESAIDRVREKMASGRAFSSVLSEETIFPDMVYQMIMVGEESGALPDMLDSIGDFYDDEVKELTDSLASAIEPVMIVGIGALVGAMVVALYMPMFSMFSAVSGG